MRWLALSKMALGLTLATLAALAVVGINEAGSLRSGNALEAVRTAQKVRTTLLRLLQNILDAETGQRGYLLTGEPSYREPYDTAVAQVDGRLAELRQLYAGQQEDMRRLEILTRHVARKMAEMDTSVRLRRSGDEQAWKFVMTTDVGRRLWITQSSGSPSARLAQISLHSGQTGKRSGSRLGTQTLPHSATTGVPITMASVSFSLGT